MRRFSPPAGKSHAGLLLSRFYEGKAGDKTGSKLIGDIQAASRNGRFVGVYRRAFERWTAMIDASGGLRADFHADGRVAVGLGIETPIEVGLRLHHTYGTPLIPGSALKGASAAYCRDLWKWNRLDDAYSLLFGDTDAAGLVEFEDAWILPDSLENPKTGLVRDIVTPHHPKYYNGDQPPLDSDEPIPVAHLSVAGDFRVAVCGDPRLEHRTQWQERAMKLIEAALLDWGIGGRTRSGYGQFSKRPSEAVQ